MPRYKVGEAVEKYAGDYAFTGWVVAVLTKRTGQVRYVVEDERGLLLILNETQLRPREEA